MKFMNHVKHAACSIIYISLIIPSYSTKIDHSGNIQHPNHSIVSPSISLRLRGLAQAKQSRSGESPSAQARLETRKTGTTAGSRLSEWFARSKVERVVWATFRAIWPRWALVCLA